MFQQYVSEQMRRVKASPWAEMLSGEVVCKLEAALLDITGIVTKSTLNRWIAQEAAGENPFALSLPELITDEQRQSAIATIQNKLASGEMTFPQPLIDTMKMRLAFVADAFLEMLGRMAENREAICAALTDGRLYEKIEDITLSAGDTHNRGRSVTVLLTDAGRLVYKPHDMRGDAHICAIAQRFFPEFAGIPKCIAFGDSFGVCEFIEKRRSQGEEEARRFWYRMGGMTAFIKLLGSTDMHFENVTCMDGKPYLIDLETVLSPVLLNKDYSTRYPELNVLKGRSPYLSCFLPNSPKGEEYSPLMNTEEKGCAPVVNGEMVSVAGYLDAFKEGYDTAYRRAVEHREEIAEMIRDIPDTVPVRILMRNTQAYVDLLTKLYHHTALSSRENQENAAAILEKILSNQVRPGFESTVQAEIRQMKRGDVPYVFAAAGGRALLSDGEMLLDGVFERSAKEHALDNLRAMGDWDELFDVKLLERAIRQYPVRLRDGEKKPGAMPRRTESPLSREAAFREAERLLEEAYSLHIPAPDGKLFWGYMEGSDNSFRFCDPGFSNGLTGFAAFAAAFSSVSENLRFQEMAERIIQETVIELKRALNYFRSKGFSFDYSPVLGEADGTSGMITGMELVRKYAPGQEWNELDQGIDELLEKTDYQRYGAPDRFIGMSGLLSVLCRFDRYRGKKEIIRKAADSLLAMKTLKYEGKTLWKTLPNNPRPISGAGHGLAGIAEALYAASKVLGEEKYAAAAAEALGFEREIYEKYHKKFGTWADLRSYPPQGYMHGYCSGAPGIGIMLERIRRAGIEDETVEYLARCARASVDGLPLNGRDHLCCGNSAIAEYYMSVEDFQAAGRVLGAMAERREKEGTYRYLSYDYNNSLTPSLFYGCSGVGYEMLRYAYPDKIISVL